MGNATPLLAAGGVWLLAEVDPVGPTGEARRGQASDDATACAGMMGRDRWFRRSGIGTRRCKGAAAWQTRRIGPTTQTTARPRLG